MLTNLALTPVGAKTRFLRLPARAYDSVSFGIQFGASGTPAGPLAFTVDVGADGTVDFSYSGTPASYPAVISVGNAAVTAAFNAYLAGRTGEVDVPIRIVPSPSLDTALASFSATPTARPDASIGPGDVTFGGVVAARHGTTGYPDTAPAQSVASVSSVSTPSVASTLSVSSRSVTSVASAPASMSGPSAAGPSVASVPASVSGPSADPTEGDTITIHATIHNPGSLATGPLTAAFYAVRTYSESALMVVYYPQRSRIWITKLPCNDSQLI
jgi:hypothetical protein